MASSSQAPEQGKRRTIRDVQEARKKASDVLTTMVTYMERCSTDDELHDRVRAGDEQPLVEMESKIEGCQAAARTLGSGAATA